MPQAPYITKGTRVQAEWFVAQTNPPACLAGMQMKLGATHVAVIGRCVHFRGDDPVNPKEVRIYIDVEGELPSAVQKVVPHGCTHEGGHVEIREEWIVGIEDEHGKTWRVSGK